MKVQEFVNYMKEKDFDLVSAINIKKYMPVIDKKNFALNVFATCTYNYDGYVSVDYFKKNIYFNMMMLSMYTDLEIATDFDEMMAQYDTLCEIGVMKHMKSVLADEYDEMNMVCNNVFDELLAQNSIDAHIARVANKIGVLIDVANDKLNEFDIGTLLPDGADIEELIDMMKILK